MIKHIFHLLPILLCLSFSILWPFWLTDGYLDTTYLKVVTFIAAYGGLIGNTVWYIKWAKNNKR
jgi:hypothetical protein